MLDNLPFELPNGWFWIRQSNLCWLDNGEKTKAGQLPYWEAKAIRNKKADSTLNEGVVVDPTFRLILVDGENSGEILIPPAKGYMGSTFKILKVTDQISFEYLLLLFEINRNLYKNNKVGAAIPHLNKKLFRENLIALPPLSEQKRIVQKTRCFDVPLFKYRKIETNLSELESNFEKKLKASILQYAIEGKLVKQDPNDEPASMLLERIKEEKEKLIKEGKIKRDKSDSAIIPTDDKDYYRAIETGTADYSFNIPGCWRIVRLGSLFSHNTGKALNQKEKDGMLKEYITTSNVYWNRFVLLNLKKMYFKEKELDKCTVHQGDLLVCEGGDIGRSAIWKEPYDICIQNHIHRLRPYIPEVCQEFYLYVLWLYKYTGAIGGKGIGIQGLSSNALDALMLPLPPYNEQKRIIAKINSLSQVI